MNVSLTLVLEEFVRRKVATGLYNNASEVVREALRLMVERETGGRPAPKKSEVVATLKALEPELRDAASRRPPCSGRRAWPGATGQRCRCVVDVDPAAQFDLLDLVGVRNLLADRLGHMVDVVEQEALKPRIRDSILAEAETVF